MSLKCRVFRDEKGQIDFVNAANGNRSKLFDNLVNITGGNRNTALNIYALTEVEELKDAMAAKLNAFKERFKNIVKVAPADARFSIVGLKGAQNLDTISGSTVIVDNLEVAIEMERSNETPLKIKIATGWQRGADNQWKYELDSSKASLNLNIDSINKLGKKYSLKSILNYPELFKAYPELNDVKISVSKKGGTTTEGFFDGSQIVLGIESNKLKDFFEAKSKAEEFKKLDPEVIRVVKKFIEIDAYEDSLRDAGMSYSDAYRKAYEKYTREERDADLEILNKFGYANVNKTTYGSDFLTYNDKFSELVRNFKRGSDEALQKSDFNNLNAVLLPVTLHEIQHWIQQKEGFARGSNTVAIYSYLTQEQQNEYKNLSEEKKKAQEKLTKEGKKWYDAPSEIRDIIFAPSDYLYQKYRSAMGEEEARNVEKRLKMTPKERLYSLLQDTEENARENQIFIPQNRTSFNQIESNQKEVLDQVTDRLEQSGLANNVYKMTNAEIEAKLIELGISPETAKSVVAYHGSPYSFDRFTTEKMGTGEGAQAFGWGLYFTDLDSIAKEYANALYSNKQENLGFFELLADDLEDFGYYEKEFSYLGVNKRGVEALDKLKKDTDFNKKEVQKLKKPEDLSYVSYLKEQIKIAEDVINSADEYLKGLPSRNLYKVSLQKGKEVGEYNWLEWDKPINEKILEKLSLPIRKKLFSFNEEELNKAVKKASIPYLVKNKQLVSREGIKDFYETLGFSGDRLSTLVASRLKSDSKYFAFVLEESAVSPSETFKNKKDAQDYLDSYKLDRNENIFPPNAIKSSVDIREEVKKDFNVFDYNVTGEELYKRIIERLTASDYNRDLEYLTKSGEPSSKEASLFLLENGIDGIKYPAESIARGATSDTARGFNYVVFDENAVTIDEQIQFSKQLARRDTRLKVIKEALKIEAYTPEVEVANYFLSGGRVSEESIKKLYRNSKGEVKARMSLISKTAPSINQIAQSLWENSEIRDDNGDSTYTDQDYVNFIEELLTNNNTRKSIAEEVLRPYQIENNIPEEDYLYLLSDEYIESQILEREEFERLSYNGVQLTTAGFTYKGDVYLNSDAMRLDTPIHEFGHLHLDWLKENRNDLYKAGLSLIGKNKEEAQQYIDIVKETQPDLEEGSEKFNNEVLAQVIGDQGAKLVNSKKEDSIADWLKSVWESIKDILGLTSYTADEVANMTLAEFGTASSAEMLSGRVIKDGLDFSTFLPNKVISGVNEELVNLSEQYKKDNNLPLELPRLVISLSEKDAMRVADAYDEMKHSPNNPEVKLAYSSLITEIKKQADLLLNAGYKFELSTKERGYNSSSEMIKDVKDNKHIFIDPSSENFGTTREFNEDNIGLADSGYKDINGNPLTNVEVIRAVHDVFGHAKFGTQFGAIGEENAWRVHMSMFSPEAQKALTATTRGQNSWVNFGKHMRKDGELIKKGEEGYMSPTERPFAEQKIGILPNWATDNSYGDTVTINGKSITPVNKYSISGEEIYEIADGQAYYDAILSAKNSRLGTDIPEDVRDGIQVYVKSAKEYQDIVDKGGKLLVSKDGLTGVMVEADGNIGSGFNHSSNTKPNSLAPYLIAGIKMGARYTDAYDTYLPKYYAKFGFVASERMKFDETYAEEGWDKSILKTKPDVVFMYFDGGDRMTIEDRVGTFEPYKKTDGEYIEDYDQGVENTKNKNSEKGSLIPLVSKPGAYDVNYSMVTPTSKNISPENSSNYANLTEDGQGNFVFYHVGKSGYDVIKRTSGSTINTSREEAQALAKVGGLAMYYSRPEDGETMITGESKYIVKIPMNKVYDFNTDSLNLTEKAKVLHSKEHPGKSFDANTQVAYVTKVAADFGYEMVVAEWQNRTRAQSIKEHKPNDTQVSEGATIKKPFQENYESNSSKGFKSVIPVPKNEQLKQLYLDLNNYRNRENRYDDIYGLYEEYSKLSQEEITKRIESSDIPQEYKSKYESIVSSEEGKRMSTYPVQKSVIRQPSLELNGTKIFAKDRVNPVTGEKLDGVEWELIESTERGQGNARKAAELFLNGTDAQGKDVYLVVSPRDNTTKPERLESFYTSLGFEKTSDFEMVRKARPVSLKDTDSNGEPSIKTLMDFSNSKVKPLGLEGLKAAKNAAMALKVKSSKELVEKMEKALMKNGIVLFDKLSLQRSKLYNIFEINTILSSPKLQKQIKESLLSLRNSEPFELDYDENFIIPQGREVNQFGKQEVINPSIVEKDLVESVAGLEESEIDEALPTTFSNKYYTDPNFKETVDSIARDHKKAPVKTVVDGELVDKTEDVEGMLLNTMTDDLDISITEDIAFLRQGIDKEIFNSDLKNVSKVLNKIKKNVQVNGIDLRNFPTLALELSRDEVLGFLDSMEDVIEDPSNPENMIEFTERYYKLLGDKEAKTEVIKTNSENDVVVEEPLSEYEMFSEFGLVKKDDGIYRKVKEQSLDSLYESFFEYKNLLPEGIDTLEALKLYVERNASLLEVSDYEVDVDNLEKIFLYKKFFDFPMSTQRPTVKVDNFNKITNSEEYLTDEFLKDFNKWILTTSNPYFKVTGKGIELVNSDEMSKAEAVDSVPERFKQELAEYNIISDSLNLEMPLLEEKPEDINTQLEQRQKAVNNPDRVKKVSGQYTYLKDGVLAVKNESETFVKTPIGVFEKIFEFENIKFYGKLDTDKKTGYKKVNVEAPFSDISFQEYMYLANAPEAFKTSKNYYSKKELDDINEEYFGCQ